MNRRQLEVGLAVGIAVVAVATVAASSAAQSFGHMYDWALSNGEPHWRSILFPVSVDGMLVAASAVLYVDHRMKRPPHRLAYVLMVAGVAVSISANVLHDWVHVFAEKWIAAWGPIALLGSFELFVRFLRSLAPLAAAVPASGPVTVAVEVAQADVVLDTAPPAESAPEPAGEPVVETPPATVADAPRTAPPEPPAVRPEVKAAIALAAHRVPSHAATSPKPSPARTVTAAAPAPTDGAPGGKQKALEYFTAQKAKGRTPTGPELADIAGVNRRTGARWLAIFEQQVAAPSS